MARRISDEARVEEWFMNAETDAALVMLEKVWLILRVRGIKAADPPKKRGRKPKAQQPTLVASQS